MTPGARKLNAIAPRRVEVIGNATLYLADCREVLPTLSGGGAVVTDPPYGIGFPYNSYKDTQEGLEALVASFVPMARAVAQRVVITPGITNACLYPRPDWMGAWTWETTATFGALGYNQWQPILFYGQDLAGFGNVNGVTKTDRIHFTGGSAKINQAEGGGHTCPKPLAFVRRLLLRFSGEGEVVIDPFMGSGTTGVAAVGMGRPFVGIEMDPAYFEIACRRIEDAQRQTDLFLNTIADAAGATEGLI